MSPTRPGSPGRRWASGTPAGREGEAGLPDRSQSTATVTEPDPGPGRGPGRQLRREPQGRAGAAGRRAGRGGARRAGLDDLPGPGPTRDLPAARPRCHRRGPARAGARATSRPSPGTWCMSMSRSSAGSPTAAGAGTRPRLGPHQAAERAKTAGARAGYVYLHTAIDDHSRLAYTEELLDEKGSTAAAVLGAGGEVLPPPRHPPDPPSAHRQRLLLPLAACSTPRWRRRDPPQVDPALPAPDQRQGRALPPHPGPRMGLPTAPGPATSERAAALQGFLDRYNYARPHTALERTATSQPPPISVTNLAA